jgi:hypothetical protein
MGGRPLGSARVVFGGRRDLFQPGNLCAELQSLARDPNHCESQCGLGGGEAVLHQSELVVDQPPLKLGMVRRTKAGEGRHDVVVGEQRSDNPTR